MNIKYIALIVAILISIIYIPANYLIVRDIPENRQNVIKTGFPFAVESTVQDDTGEHIRPKNVTAIAYNSIIVFLISLPATYLLLRKYEARKVTNPNQNSTSQ